MDDLMFWEIIDNVKISAETNDERINILKHKLTNFTAEEIIVFQKYYEKYIAAANTWILYGAAYLMNDGCSDDGFRYFRDWLISEGKSVYELALIQPDSLAVLPKQDYFDLELFGYVAVEVFKETFNSELERDFSDELTMPSGDEWEYEELETLLPHLWSRYAET